MTPRIPIDPIGYAVEGNIIHTRYNSHARGERTRTEKGVLMLLNGRKGRSCPDCYPHPVYRTDKPKRPQRRRTPTNGDTAALASERTSP